MKNNRDAEKPKRRIRERMDPSPVPPGSHQQLSQIAIELPTDYEPYGQINRESFVDCS